MNKLEGRTNNIKLTCEMINGLVLEPNAVFSFNKIVGNRTAKRGFKPAPAFVNGQVVDSIGGGICQLSSTLYYASLLANLEIVSRTQHSFCPDYLEQAGLDATVDWDEGIDFKFKNNIKYPIKILTWLKDSKVHVKLLGKKTNNNTVVMETKTLSKTPAKTVIRNNPKLAAGEKKVIQPTFDASTVETYRIVKDEKGKIISRTFEAKSQYKRLDGIIECGNDD